MRVAAETGNESARVAGAREFVDFFGRETLRHFREEEEVVFPLLLEHPEVPHDLLERALLEHLRMHRCVARLRGEVASGAVEAGSLQATSSLLEAHVRLEERELFPLLERVVPEAELSGITLAERDRSRSRSAEGV